MTAKAQRWGYSASSGTYSIFLSLPAQILVVLPSSGAKESMCETHSTIRTYIFPFPLAHINFQEETPTGSVWVTCLSCSQSLQPEGGTAMSGQPESHVYSWTTDVRMPHIISRPSRTTWYGEDKLLKESGGALD